MSLCCCGNSGNKTIIAKQQQIGSLQKLGIKQDSGPTMYREEVSVPVYINVYSLLENNKRLIRMGMGVFHSGIVVYGIEWGYGEVVDNPNASGLFCVHPGEAAGDLYRTIQLGSTTMSPMQVDTLLHRMENEWRSCDYHILHHNCNHFAQALCDRLSTHEKLIVPSWCNRAARMGDRVVPRKLATKVQRMMDDEPPKATVPEPVSNINEVPESVIPAKWYLHPKVYQPPRYIRPLPKRQSTSRRGSRRSGSRSGRSSRSSSISSLSYAPPPGYEPTNEESWFSKKKTRSSSIRSDGPVKPLVSVEEWVSPRRSSRKKTKKENSTSTLPVPKPPRRPSATKVVAEEPIAKVPSKKEPKTPHEDGGEDKQEVSVERSRSQYMGIAKHLTLPLFESVSMEGEEEVDDSGDSVQMEDDLTVYEEYAGHGEEDGGSDGDSPYETPFRLNPHQAGPVGTLIIAPRALSRSVSKYSKKSDKSKIDHRAHTPLSSNSSSRSSDAAVKDITDQEEDWSKVALPSLPPVPSSPSASLKRDGPANVKADSPPKNAPLGARRGSLSDLPPVCKPQRLAPLNVTSPVEKPSPAVTSPVVSNHGEEKNTVRPVMSFPQLRPRTFSLTQYEEGKRQLDRRFSTDMTTSVPCLPSSSEGSPQKEHHGALTPNGSTRPPLARRALHEGKSPTSGENSVKEEGFHMMEKVE